jgi:GNAT superfamily N-acetyltransferase
MKIQYFDFNNPLSQDEKSTLIDFLHTHLDQYGDPREHIKNCIEFATKEIISFGGFILVSPDVTNPIAAVVINNTGMRGYIPEHILVYIATHRDHRGKGLGKQLVQSAIEKADGDIALHVEAENPAKFLYEKLGFTNPYLEMRLKKDTQ